MVYFMENPKEQWMIILGVPPWIRNPPWHEAYPQIMFVHKILHSTSSILGCPHLRKPEPPFVEVKSHFLRPQNKPTVNS